MAKRRRKVDRKRDPDQKGIFGLNPIQQDVLKWGLVAGAAGGLFIIQGRIVWQIVGVFAAVFISNYQITKAAHYIPRWQATAISFIGMIVAMLGVSIIGTVLLAYLA